MKIPDSILWPGLVKEDPKLRRIITEIDAVWRKLTATINGRVELSRMAGGSFVTENMGYPITGTSHATPGNANVVAHKLGRIPRFLWVMPEHALGTTPQVFYWSASDYLAWTENNVTFKCTGASIGFRGWVI